MTDRVIGFSSGKSGRRLALMGGDQQIEPRLRIIEVNKAVTIGHEFLFRRPRRVKLQLHGCKGLPTEEDTRLASLAGGHDIKV